MSPTNEKPQKTETTGDQQRDKQPANENWSRTATENERPQIFSDPDIPSPETDTYETPGENAAANEPGSCGGCQTEKTQGQP